MTRVVILPLAIIVVPTIGPALAAIAIEVAIVGVLAARDRAWRSAVWLAHWATGRREWRRP